MAVYGYARISRKTQNIERQIRNILSVDPKADIKQEAYTGTKVDGRKEFNNLIRKVKPNDKIIFDSVSRMSRDADEGVKLYFELFEKGVVLEFIKEPHINTSVYAENLNDKIALTGTDEDEIFKGLNNYFRKIAEKQIRIAFEQAEKEVKDLHQRTSEGIETARQAGKQIGQKKGSTLNIKKKSPIKAEIKAKSKDFNGTYTDTDLIKVLGIARNTYYKYKKELLQEIIEEIN